MSRSKAICPQRRVSADPVVHAVVPGTARPDRVAQAAAGAVGEEVAFDDPDLIVEIFGFQPGDQSHGLGGGVAGKADLAAVPGERVAFDGYDVVTGCGQRHHELAVVDAHDRNGRTGGGMFFQRGQELGKS